MSFGEQFRYATLRDEVVIGEVYVRVYNQQPTFVLEVRGKSYIALQGSCDAELRAVLVKSFLILDNECMMQMGCVSKVKF